MATTYGTEMTKLRNTTPPEKPDAGAVSGKLRVFSETFTMAAQAAGDIIELARLPKGARVLFGVLNASATLGAAATLAIGIAGNTGKYRAAAVHTTADAPVLFGVNAGMGVKLAAEEIVIGTVAVAALPGAGNVNVMMVYTIE